MRPDLTDLHARIGTQPATYLTGYRQYVCDRCGDTVTHVVMLPGSRGRRRYVQVCRRCYPASAAERTRRSAP